MFYIVVLLTVGETPGRLLCQVAAPRFEDIPPSVVVEGLGTFWLSGAHDENGRAVYQERMQ